MFTRNSTVINCPLRAGTRRSSVAGDSGTTLSATCDTCNVHAHRVLSHALDDAVRHDVMARNVARLQPPRVQTDEMAILDREGNHSILPGCPATRCMLGR